MIIVILFYRYLASGDSMISIKYQYYISQTTITNIITETCEELWNILMPVALKIPTCNEWKKIAKDFEINCNFPHCLGAVDGKHVVVQVISNKCYKLFCHFIKIIYTLPYI